MSLSRLQRLAVILCASGASAGAARGQPSGTADIVGRVTLAKTERAEPGAQVLLLDPSARTLLDRAVTDASGRYRFAGLRAGGFTLVVRAVGARPDTVRLSVADGAHERRDVALVRSPSTLTEVVVTTQNRAEAAREVPVAVTALDGDFLRQTSVQEFDALSAYVPGLNVQLQSPNNPGFVVRGITSDDGSSQVEPRVSVFQDGVSISKSRGSVVELYDLERVEVLKGPQGTLFGRGAQIGAVHVIQNKPSAAPGAELRIGGGNYGEVYANGFVNGPLVSDRVFARVAGIYDKRDGFIANGAGGRLNGKETAALRGVLRVLPSTRTVVDIIGNWQRDTPPGTAFRAHVPVPGGASATDDFAPAFLESGSGLGLDRTVWGVTALANQQLGAAWALHSISAFRRFDSDEAFDADGTAAPALRFNEIAHGDQASQELRLTYDHGGRFTGFGGANYFWEQGSQRVPLQTDERSLFLLLVNAPAVRQGLAAAGVALPAFPSFVNADGTANLSVTTNPLTRQPLKTSQEEAYANYGRTSAAEAFLDGTLRVTGGLKLTAGVRGTYEDVRNGYAVTNSATPGTLGALLGVTKNDLFAPTPNGRVIGTGSFRSAVGRAIASYETPDGTNLFVGAARGRRPNVVQVTAAGANTLADEIVWSYEAGAKTALFGDRIALDANVYTYDYAHFQTTVTVLRADGSPAQQTQDAGNAHAYGAESTVRAQLARPATVFATYGYLEARISDTDDEGRRQALAGKQFRLAPKHTGSVGLTLDTPLASVGRLSITPSVTYKSHVYFEAQNQAGIEQAGYGLVSVRASLLSRDGRWDLTGVAHNLGDRRYIIDAGNTGGAFGVPTFIAGQPRFLTLQVGRRF